MECVGFNVGLLYLIVNLVILLLYLLMGIINVEMLLYEVNFLLVCF